MSTFNARLGIGDIIYSVNLEGYKHPYIINQVLFTSKDISYKNAIGAHICFDWELDSTINSDDKYRFYFTSVTKREDFIKTMNL